MSAAISYKSSLCRNPPCSTCHSFVGENEVWPRVSYAIEPSNLLFACNFIPVDNILLILSTIFKHVNHKYNDDSEK